MEISSWPELRTFRRQGLGRIYMSFTNCLDHGKPGCMFCTAADAKSVLISRSHFPWIGVSHDGSEPEGTSLVHLDKPEPFGLVISLVGFGCVGFQHPGL